MKLLYALILIIFIFSNVIIADELNTRPNNSNNNNKKAQTSNAKATSNNQNNNQNINNINNNQNQNQNNNNNINNNNVNNQINQDNEFHLPWFIHTNKQEFELFSSEVLSSFEKSINGNNIDQSNNNNNCIRGAFEKLTSESNSNKESVSANEVPSFNYFIRLISDYSKKCNIEAATNRLVNSLNYIYSNGLKSFIPYYYNNLSNEQKIVYCFRSAVYYSYDRPLQANKLGQCFASMIMNEKQQQQPSAVKTSNTANAVNAVNAVNSNNAVNSAKALNANDAAATPSQIQEQQIQYQKQIEQQAEEQQIELQIERAVQQEKAQQEKAQQQAQQQQAQQQAQQQQVQQLDAAPATA